MQLLSDFRVTSTIVDILNSPEPLPATFEEFLQLIFDHINEDWCEVEEAEEEFEEFDECAEEVFESFQEYEDSVRSKLSAEHYGDEDSL